MQTRDTPIPKTEVDIKLWREVKHKESLIYIFLLPTSSMLVLVRFNRIFNLEVAWLIGEDRK